MPIPDTTAALAGRFVIVTSAPHWRGFGGRLEWYTADAHPAIGDVLLAFTERDREGNVFAVDAVHDVGAYYALSVDCLSVITAPPSAVGVAEIPREVAAHVLHAFSGSGYPAGEFFRAVIVALTLADPANAVRLSLAYPDYALAVRLAKEHPAGMDILTAINRGETRAVEVLARDL